MKIHITKNEQKLIITLPTKMLLNKFVLSLILKNHRTGLNGISRRDIKILVAQLEKVKERHGSWDLIEVDSSDGEKVTISL